MTLTAAQKFQPPPNHHRMLRDFCTNVLVHSNPALHNERPCFKYSLTEKCCLWHAVSNSVTPDVTAQIYMMVKNAEKVCNIQPTSAGMFYLSSSKEWLVKMMVQSLDFTALYDDTVLAYRIFNNLSRRNLALLLANLLRFPVVLDPPPPDNVTHDLVEFGGPVQRQSNPYP